MNLETNYITNLLKSINEDNEVGFEELINGRLTICLGVDGLIGERNKLEYLINLRDLLSYRLQSFRPLSIDRGEGIKGENIACYIVRSNAKKIWRFITGLEFGDVILDKIDKRKELILCDDVLSLHRDYRSVSLFYSIAKMPLKEIEFWINSSNKQKWKSFLTENDSENWKQFMIQLRKSKDNKPTEILKIFLESDILDINQVKQQYTFANELKVAGGFNMFSEDTLSFAENMALKKSVSLKGNKMVVSL